LFLKNWSTEAKNIAKIKVSQNVGLDRGVFVICCATSDARKNGQEKGWHFADG